LNKTKRLIHREECRNGWRNSNKQVEQYIVRSKSNSSHLTGRALSPDGSRSPRPGDSRNTNLIFYQFLNLVYVNVIKFIRFKWY
jgi:hypothetical protein